MRMCLFPLFCGGRLLLGVYNTPIVYAYDQYGNVIRESVPGEPLRLKMKNKYSDEEVYQAHITDSLNSHLSSTEMWGENRHKLRTQIQKESSQYITSNLRLNQQLLVHCLKSPVSAQWVAVGSIVAVTNHNETHAVEMFENSGFKKAAETSKFGTPEERGRSDHQCITWIGDFHRDIRPILQPIANEIFGTEIVNPFARR